MAQERLSMRKIQEVLRLKWDCKLSNRAVARSCNVGYGTVCDYIQRAKAAGLSWPLPDGLGEDQLYRLLFPDSSRPHRVDRPAPDWSIIHTELRRKGVTLRLLWLEYRELHLDGYGYSQFCEHYSRWVGRLKPSMRFNHTAGEKCFVDYAGPTVDVIDADTGEVLRAAIFVGVLGASSYTYAEAHSGQTLANWVGAHVRMFSFFGGRSQVLVPDNLKSGVKHPCRYDPVLNPTYQDLAEHYGVAVLPARVRKPKDKAKAEVGVQVVERWILARLRRRTFFSLGELNRAIRELLDELNQRPMRAWGKSRRQLFVEIEQSSLQPLPDRAYDEQTVLLAATIGVDYHIGFDKSFYSVPYRLIRQPVMVRATANTVEVFHKGNRVASHCRSRRENWYATLDEHRPPAHRAHLEWSPERFLRWANKIGPAAAELIQIRLNSKTHPEHSFRACLGILGLTKKYGDVRLEAACRRALASGIHFYKGIKNILDHSFDRLDLDRKTDTTSPVHANVRGKTYYH
jgi:transposase